MSGQWKTIPEIQWFINIQDHWLHFILGDETALWIIRIGG